MIEPESHDDDLNTAGQKPSSGEFDLRRITDAIRQSIVVLSPDGATLYVNRVALQTTGLSMSEVTRDGFLARGFHPEDLERIREDRSAGLANGLPFELEARIRRPEGHYRWHLIQYNPEKNEQGEVVRWYATTTDIDEQKKREERLRDENLILREEIDRTSMF